MESLRTIGRLARESGLSVSALRFYDGAGVLVPVSVDPGSGYRYYAPDQVVAARLVASLRRVGMPLTRIREVLERRHDPAAVDAVLDRHLHRLEQGLADARHELSRVRSLITLEEPVPPTTVTVRGPELADALRAVRFAVGSDPGFPALTGVLFDVTTGAVTRVATDRYRLAIADVDVRDLDGPAVAAVVPAAFADRIPTTGEVAITIDAGDVTVRAEGRTLEGAVIPEAFPDHRRLLPAHDRPVPVDAALRAAVAGAPTRTVRREQDGADCAVAVLVPTAGGVAVSGDGDGDGIGVDRAFLLEAFDAGGEGQLTLSLDGPVAPLVIRSPRSVSLLMPVRLPETGFA
ncbi:MerR family transcriptional regulator [Pseudonocardia kunmingensis]|uniref:DNA polymerase III beta subunit-like protein n=1 Tax=Pseudonocardia kunmingensis TaxID=630975 RepID=A0A543E469_9PSEU|nr:MerR family transcriptional regulator [Pseudonocardia kunmingensis]TQM16249.1 DNA polymerase III beta subunit-like protein [Pseudonocardia kunmingensis]